MSRARVDEEVCPLLVDQAHYRPFARDDGAKSYWAHFRNPSPMWIICIFAIYELVFGMLLVPEFNATFAIICHQRYTATGTPQYSADQPNLLAELEHCLRNKQAQSAQSQFLIYGQATAGVFGAISTPLLGSLSDQLGRNPILACAVIGPLIHELLILVLLWFPDSLDVHWLLLGYAMEGFSGSMIAAFATSQAYITDIAHPNDRARLFSYLQATISFACATGPIIAGVLLAILQSLDLIYCFVVCAHLFLAIMFLFILPESRWTQQTGIIYREGHIQESAPKDNSVPQVLSSLRLLWSSDLFRGKSMILMAFMDSVLFGIMMGLPPLQLAYPAFLFGWESTAQSLYVSIYYSWSILVLVVLFPIVMARVPRWTRAMRFITLPAVFRAGEMGTVQINLILQVIGYIGIASVQIPGFFILVSLLVASSAPIAPLLTSCLTAPVPHHQTGQLLGMLSFSHAIARISIPPVLNFTYSMTMGFYPAPLFMLLALISGMLLVASMYVKTNVL